MQKNFVNYTFPDGTVLKLFYIGTLAERLGRKSDTIRKWEVQGVIPETIFKDRTGKRLYSDEQINIIVEEAEKAHISQGRPVSRTNFVRYCSARMEELNNLYRQAMKAGVVNE